MLASTAAEGAQDYSMTQTILRSVRGGQRCPNWNRAHKWRTVARKRMSWQLSEAGFDWSAVYRPTQTRTLQERLHRKNLQENHVVTLKGNPQERQRNRHRVLQFRHHRCRRKTRSAV